MSERPILTVAGLGKRFGGFVALESIDLTVATGERLGLIGPNGSGKSTLVNCLCGTLHNETGSVRRRSPRFDANWDGTARFKPTGADVTFGPVPDRTPGKLD